MAFSTRFQLLRDEVVRVLTNAVDLVNEVPTAKILSAVYRAGEVVTPPDDGGAYAIVTFGAEKLHSRTVGLEQAARETTATAAGGKQTLFLPISVQVFFFVSGAQVLHTRHAHLLGNLQMAMHQADKLNGEYALSMRYLGGGTELLAPDGNPDPSHWAFIADFEARYQQRIHDPRTT